MKLEYETPLFNRDAYLQKNHNWSELQNFMGDIGNHFQANFDSQTARIDNLIRGISQPSEVVDARLDALNKGYPTLKARLDAEQEVSVESLKIGVSDANVVMFIRDLTTTSGNLSYEVVSSTTDPDLQALGYVETSVNRITYDRA